MECPICFNIIKNSAIGSCTHHFCLECLLRWCEVGDTKCPVCKTSICAIKRDIEFDKLNASSIKSVSQFREKPDYDTAKEFIAKGNFLWNAGIFMWSANSVISAFKNNQPELYQLFEQGIDVYNTEFEDDFISENYGKAENISVDYAIMEKSNNVYVLPATFDWNDLGTWGSLYDKLDKDLDKNAVVNAKTLTKNASGNLIRTNKDKIVIIDGLNDYIIVDKNEVLLIFPKEKEQNIKKVLQKVKDKFGESYG